MPDDVSPERMVARLKDEIARLHQEIADRDRAIVCQAMAFVRYGQDYASEPVPGVARPARRLAKPEHAALARELRRTTGYPDSSIYRWLSSGEGPKDPTQRQGWFQAVVLACQKLGLDLPRPDEVPHGD